MILWIVFLIVAGTVALIFNQLVHQRNLVEEAASGIDVQLKRRYDLVPNLVETVKGYRQHEQSLFEQVTKLRAQLMAAGSLDEKKPMENNFSRSLKSIFALAENYPDLKANQSFLDLQKSLVDIEDQLQMARRYYNGSVRNYNILAQSFPANVVAAIFGFKGASFFEIEYATERQTPDVKF